MNTNDEAQLSAMADTFRDSVLQALALFCALLREVATETNQWDDDAIPDLLAEFDANAIGDMADRVLSRTARQVGVPSAAVARYAHALIEKLIAEASLLAADIFASPRASVPAYVPEATYQLLATGMEAAIRRYPDLVDRLDPGFLSKLESLRARWLEEGRPATYTRPLADAIHILRPLISR